MEGRRPSTRLPLPTEWPSGHGVRAAQRRKERERERKEIRNRSRIPNEQEMEERAAASSPYKSSLVGFLMVPD